MDSEAYNTVSPSSTSLGSEHDKSPLLFKCLCACRETCVEFSFFFYNVYRIMNRKIHEMIAFYRTEDNVQMFALSNDERATVGRPS